MKTIIMIISVLMIQSCSGEKGPYNTDANAGIQIQSALAVAQSKDKLILLEFGANWCPDCVALAGQMHKSPLKELLESNFVQVKIDIGDGEKNEKLVKKYGNATRKGIPSVVILDKDDNLLTGTLTGQLANARNMGDKELYVFFEKIIARSNAKIKVTVQTLNQI